MGKYTITWKCPRCGQETSEVVNCRGRDIDWETKKRQNNLCEECQEKEDAAFLKALQEENYSHGLPVLTGSPKQIEWAEAIRKESYNKLSELKAGPTREFMLRGWARVAKKYPDDKDAELYHLCVDKLDEFIDAELDELRKNTSAGRIIDNRCEDWRSRLEKRARKVIALRSSEEKELEETLLVPKDQKKEVTVTIVIKDGKIYAGSEYEPVLNGIYKKFQMSFNRRLGLWWKSFSPTMESLTDSAADLANTILRHGWMVKVPRLVGEMVESKTFTPDRKTWVEIGKYNDFVVRTTEDDPAPVLEAAAKMFGRKDYYGNPYAKLHQYQAVEEFAELYNAAIDTSAAEAIARQKIAQKTIDPVEAQLSKDGLKEILSSSREVLDDLKD